MANIKQVETILPIAALLDQYNGRSHLTLLLNGVQGIGKSEAVYLASAKLNGTAAYYNANTIDGGTLYDGDLGGNPYKKRTGRSVFNIQNYIQEYNKANDELVKAFNNGTISDKDYDRMVGSITNALLENNIAYEEELEYAKHPVISAISKLQEHYYNLAKTVGFNLPSGKLKIDENGNEIIILNDGEIQIVKEYNHAEQLSTSFRNQFAFGENLSPEDRIHLIITKQINVYFCLVDELNRPDPRVMSEMMNFVLNRTINGYNLPWWVCLAAAQNPAGSDSDYATTALEPAQLDRFCFIDMRANMDEWVIHALSNGLPEEYVYAVMNGGDKCFSPDDLVDREMPAIKPSPRSNTVAGNVIKYFDQVMALPCFNEADRKESEYYLSTILSGILGPEAKNIIMLNLQDKETMVTINDILTGRSKQVDPEVVNKIKRKTIISQKMLIVSLIQWLCQNWLSVCAKKTSPNKDDQVVYMNYFQQLAEFIGLLDPSIMNYFCEMVNTNYYDVRMADGTLKPNIQLLRYVYPIVNLNPDIMDNYSNVKRQANID